MQESEYATSGPFMAGWGGQAFGQNVALDCGLLKAGQAPAQGAGHPIMGATAQGAAFDALGFDLGGAKAVVTAEAPFSLLRTSQEWLNLFCFSQEEVHGRSMRVVQGPCTDGRKLAAVVQAAANGKAAEDSVMLYSSAGQGIIVNVTAASVGDGRQQAVLLTMRPSDAVPLKTAMEHVAHSQEEACTILQINGPHSVELISPGFTRSYGLTGEQMERRTLRVIMGPLSDQQIITALFKSCAKGLAQSAHMYTARIDCTEMYVRVRAVPLFSSPGTITHMMVSFSAATANSFWMHDESPPATPLGWTPPPQVEPQDARHADVTLPAEPHLPSQPQHHQLPPHRAQIHQASAAAPMLHHIEHHDRQQHERQQHELAQHAPSQVEEQYESALRAQMNAGTPVSSLAMDFASIGMGVPRSELDKKDMSSGPVTITLELLDSFSEISLTEAAKQLGISSTAMKKACRKVGVKRWPFRKNAEESVAQFNYAYVLRIHRKYTSPAVKGRAPGAPEGGANAPSEGGELVEDDGFSESEVSEAGPAGSERFLGVYGGGATERMGVPGIPGISHLPQEMQLQMMQRGMGQMQQGRGMMQQGRVMMQEARRASMEGQGFDMQHHFPGGVYW